MWRLANGQLSTRGENASWAAVNSAPSQSAEINQAANSMPNQENGLSDAARESQDMNVNAATMWRNALNKDSRALQNHPPMVDGFCQPPPLPSITALLSRVGAVNANQVPASAWASQAIPVASPVSLMDGRVQPTIPSLLQPAVEPGRGGSMTAGGPGGLPPLLGLDPQLLRCRQQLAPMKQMDEQPKLLPAKRKHPTLEAANYKVVEVPVMRQNSPVVIKPTSPPSIADTRSTESNEVEPPAAPNLVPSVVRIPQMGTVKLRNPVYSDQSCFEVQGEVLFSVLGVMLEGQDLIRNGHMKPWTQKRPSSKREDGLVLCTGGVAIPPSARQSKHSKVSISAAMPNMLHREYELGCWNFDAMYRKCR